MKKYNEFSFISIIIGMIIHPIKIKRDIMNCAENIIINNELEDSDKAEIKLRIGQEIEKRDQKMIAYEFYQLLSLNL